MTFQVGENFKDGVYFTVSSAGAPQGSKRHVGKGVMIEMSKRVAPFRVLAAKAARAAMGDRPPLRGAVQVYVRFSFVRPPSVTDRVWPHKGGPGDVDKLQRSLFDALTTAAVWGDDSQVCIVTAMKLYAPEGEPASVQVRVTPLE